LLSAAKIFKVRSMASCPWSNGICDYRRRIFISYFLHLGSLNNFVYMNQPHCLYSNQLHYHYLSFCIHSEIYLSLQGLPVVINSMYTQTLSHFPPLTITKNFFMPEFNTETTQQRVDSTTVRKADCRCLGAVARNVNCWDAAGRQSDWKCRWQCCQMSRKNSCCLQRWTSDRSRDSVTEGRL